MAGAGTLAVGSALVIFAMIGEVNRQLPEDQQVSYLWGYPGKLSEIRDQYYPKGILGKVLDVQWVLIVIMMAASALLFGLASHNL